MLTVVIADGELSIGTFLVGVVDHTDITAAEDRTLFGVVSNCKLNKVERELLAHVDTEDETLHRLVCGPLLLGRTPYNGSKTADDLTEFGFDQGNSA